jgi:hypothetical protein
MKSTFAVRRLFLTRLGEMVHYIIAVEPCALRAQCERSATTTRIDNVAVSVCLNVRTTGKLLVMAK